MLSSRPKGGGGGVRRDYLTFWPRVEHEKISFVLSCLSACLSSVRGREGERTHGEKVERKIRDQVNIPFLENKKPSTGDATHREKFT